MSRSSPRATRGQGERLIEDIFEQPDQEHLVLIDTFGGGADPAAQDLPADLSDLIISPCMLSAEDLEETRKPRSGMRG